MQKLDYIWCKKTTIRNGCVPEMRNENLCIPVSDVHTCTLTMLHETERASLLTDKRNNLRQRMVDA